MSFVTCAWGASMVFGPAVSGKEHVQHSYGVYIYS